MANNLRRFDPFTEIARFEPLRDIEEIFRDMMLLRPSMREMEAEPRIRMDVTENEQTYTVKADIPGVRKEDIKVEIEGNKVTLTAEIKKEEEDKKGENMVRRERYVGKQMRMFTLAHEVDDAQAEARYQDGTLELTLPKKVGQTGSKQIAIH